jgi:CHASE3 domain sensor protein
VTRWLPLWVASLRATIRTKLLTAFLVMSALLLSAAGVGLHALSEMNGRAQEMVQLQRKIAAYRQLSHDSMVLLYSVATALSRPEKERLHATLRQLKQFDYYLDRLQFLSKDELATIATIRSEFERFIAATARVVELVQTDRADEGHKLQMTVASPLAERLERETNQLVNRAEADVIAGIELVNEAYANSRRVVIVCALVSVVLALGLGYAISRSFIDPVKKMEARMQQIAAGDLVSWLVT